MGPGLVQGCPCGPIQAQNLALIGPEEKLLSLGEPWAAILPPPTGRGARGEGTGLRCEGTKA